MRWLRGAVLVGLLIAASPAQASRVQIVQVDVGDRFDVEIQEELHVDGIRAERNRIVVRALRRGRYEVRDRRARLRAFDGCRSRGRHRAVCTPDDEIVFVNVGLGAGDDRLRLRGTGAWVRGHGGDDRITGAGAADTLDGGSGDDVLRGRGGGDDLDGGPGRDRLAGGRGDDGLRATDARRRPEADRLAGGPGLDTASWTGRDPVRARLGGRGTLRAGPDRGGGVEALRGGSRGDRLVGGAAGDRLYGGGGNDVLIGRGGDDRLSGGSSGGRDDARCGSGDDRVVQPREFVFVRPDCELLASGRVRVAPGVRLLADDRVEAAVDCPGLLCFPRIELLSAPRGVPGGSGRARRLAPPIDLEPDRASSLVFALNAFGRAFFAGGEARTACVSDLFNGYCVRVPSPGG